MAYTKVCKYCDLVKITWDDSEGKYIEVHSKQAHTKQRCQDAQTEAGATKPAKQGYFKTGQDQKSEDIKAAQKERKREHEKLMVALGNLTKAIVYLSSVQSSKSQHDVEDEIGFEQYREDQQSFQDEVV